METYTLQEAAAICLCHPETYRQLIKESKAPGRKIGRCYVIAAEQLAAYIRGEYLANRHAAAATEGTTCQSIKERIANTGISTSSTQAAKELDSLLAPPARKLHRNITTA
jgi:hypothetical protein